MPLADDVEGAASAADLTHCSAEGATQTVPSGLISVAGDSVIMSEVQYSYDSPVDYFVPNAVTFNKKFYLRPRKSDKVTKTN